MILKSISFRKDSPNHTSFSLPHKQDVPLTRQKWGSMASKS